MCKILEDLIDLFSNHSLYGVELNKKNVWLTLDNLKDDIIKAGDNLSKDEFDFFDGNIYIAKDAKIAPTSDITGPCIIGHKSEVRHGAYIRGPVLIGDGVVIGNSVEVKNSIIFSNVALPHFNYVGDSILGEKSHLGAGVILSNLRGDKKHTYMKTSDGKIIPIGRRKGGALVGDGAEIGCNSVLNPGTVIGKRTQVYPLVSVRGMIESDSIVKSTREIIKRVNNG